MPHLSSINFSSVLENIYRGGDFIRLEKLAFCRSGGSRIEGAGGGGGS